MNLKEEVLNLLIQQDNALSGEEIAKTFHVSRNAIWKVIQTLKKEGYKIDGVSRLGYLLNNHINIYSKAYLNHYLHESYHIEIFDELDSTTTYLKRIVNDYKSDCIICANSQTHGRGRTGKSFFSPSGGLYFSFSFRPKKESDLTLITIKVGMAVYHTLKKLYQIDCQIKWVNDLYYQHKKVCGIGSEAIIDFESKEVDAILIGIGINLEKQDFPDDLKDIATSLGLKNVNKNLIISSIINEVKENQQSHQEIISEYKEHCILMNKQITFKINEQIFSGIATDINENGNLIVMVENQKMVLKSGEVSIGSKYYE